MKEEVTQQSYLSASDLYSQLEFNTDSIYNDPPPPPFVTLAIGAALSLVGFLLWIYRVLALRKELYIDEEPSKQSFSLRVRCWLTAFTENDSALFTCVRNAGKSFLLLSLLQVNYQLGFYVMLGVCSLEACGDVLRIVLALREANSLNELVVTSKFLRADLRKHPLTTTLAPTNVYEDLTQQNFVVGMVFATQILLIVFVLADVHVTETHTCLDGTANCPVTGTLGSWAFYLMGIFMACVFHLGPKTNFGRESEANPIFWLKLFMSAKTAKQSKEGLPPIYKWYDPVEDVRKSVKISGISHYVRYLLSFLINGVGFQILVHALPIQVAAQSSLTGVVFRAVGMIYLVNLDDTNGYEMTMINPDDREDNKKPDPDDDNVSITSLYSYFAGGGQKEGEEDDLDLVKAAEQIITKAQAKLDELSITKKTKTNKRRAKRRDSNRSSASSRAEF